MDALYIVGSCLTRNTSANMSHNGYVQGLLENGWQVDIIMAESSWGEEDKGLPIWKEARYHAYPARSFADRLRSKGRGVFSAPIGGAGGDVSIKHSVGGFKQSMRSLAKRAFYLCFPPDKLYPLDKTWLKNAGRFRGEKPYDLVISNSSPAASHKLAGQLFRSGRIQSHRWIQIWEDPWYLDLYMKKDEAIRREEHALLCQGDEICYVSPLTLHYQQELYPDCAAKMRHIPLPYLMLQEETAEKRDKPLSFGYFGDYYTGTRDLRPFYQALRESGIPGYIYGDSDLQLETTSQIQVHGRTTLDQLAKVQACVTVLVQLCNLRGGQIPGKIYHYSATDKPILFILDGTEEEKRQLRSYFEPFERYLFCENEIEDIRRAMELLKHQISEGQTWAPVQAFAPQMVAKGLIEGQMRV